MMPDFGVIYVATGERYRAEAVVSAGSLKAASPGIHTTLITDTSNPVLPFDQVLSLVNPRHDFVDKIRGIQMSPYQGTVFLDSDTYVCDDISDLFDLLTRFDVAAGHSVLRVNVPIEGIPYAFTEPNTGVLGFRNSPAWDAFCADWLALYQRDRDTLRGGSWEGKSLAGDQAAFRELFYHSELRLATLAPEYNCRFDAGYLHGRVKILHQRASQAELERTAAILNSAAGKRVHLTHHPRGKRVRWHTADGRGGSEDVVLLALERRPSWWQRIRSWITGR
jgi:hypothetical protein